MIDMNSLGIGIVIGIPLGAVAWGIGQWLMRKYQKRHGCFDACYHCGKPPFEEV